MTDNPQPTDDRRKTVKPSGKAIRWTEADIASLAEITPADIADAKSNARRYGELNTLLNADEDDDT